MRTLSMNLQTPLYGRVAADRFLKAPMVSKGSTGTVRTACDSSVRTLTCMSCESKLGSVSGVRLLLILDTVVLDADIMTLYSSSDTSWASVVSFSSKAAGFYAVASFHRMRKTDRAFLQAKQYRQVCCIDHGCQLRGRLSVDRACAA